MKKMLLLLLASLFVMPAWASDAQPAHPSSAQAAQVAPETQTTKTPILKSILDAVVKDAHAAACPMACRTMNCPPPNGTFKLCCPVAPYNQTCP